MINKYTKNVIVSLLILSFVITPYFAVVEQAQAQSYGTSGSYSSTGAYGGGGLSGYIKGLGPAITQLPMCKQVIKSKIKGLFNGSKASNSVVATIPTLQIKSVASITKQKKDEATAVKTYDPAQLEALRKSEEATKEIERNTAKVAERVCLDSIGKMIIKLLIQKMTLATAEWIRTGVRGDGGPAFVQNPGKFFKDIAKDEILQFSGEIRGNPFGKNFLQMQAAAFNNKFAENAQYSLNELIKSTTPEYSAVAFNTNFSYGGWSAWTFMTQVPANNPLGFQVIASNELSKRLDGTFESTAKNIREDLTRASGILGQNRCADPEGITLEQHRAALEAGAMEYQYIPDPNDPDEEIPDPTKPTGYIIGTCKRWEYVTPGMYIAKELQDVTDFTDSNLLEADTINDAVAVLIDALLARFSSEIMQKGFSDFSNEGSDGAFVMNFSETNGNGGLPSQTDKDFPAHLLTSSWLEENPNFNIRTDITQPMIDEQRIYITKLQDQNVAIDHIIKTIRQLDYCIPGPNPNWETTSSVDEFYNSIKLSPREGMPPLAQMALSFDPTGIISGIANAIFNGDEEKQLKREIAKYLQNTFAVHIYGGVNDNGEQDQVIDEEGIRSLTENTFETYRNAIYRIYFAGSKALAPMPEVTSEARAKFQQIESYERIVEENTETIPLRRGIVIRLAQIKEAVEALNTQYTGNPNTPPDDNAQYENDLKQWIYYFGRLSREMVTGNDIAKVDNLLKEITEEDDYIYNNLLKGPGGCEKELEDLYIADPKKFSKYMRRQPYPLPIYYFYGNPPANPSGGNPNDPNQPDTNKTKYFGSNGPAGGGTWVGDGTAGTWWTGTPGAGMMVMDGMLGQGNWSGAGISGTWTINNAPNTPGAKSGGWTGTSGSGTYQGVCVVSVSPLTNCTGTWGGGNGAGINGGGYAPMSGIAYGGNGLNSQNISGTWTLAGGGTGTWTGSTKTPQNGSSFSLGTWQVTGNGGGADLNTGAAQWKPGSPPVGGPDPDPNPNCSDGPCQKIAWNGDLIKDWDGNQGFMYGMVYVNDWSWNVIAEGSPVDPSDGKKKIEMLCPDEFHWELFPKYVELSLPGPPNPAGANGLADLGGLEPRGSDPDVAGPMPELANVCGVITRQFEKIFNIY